MFEQNIQMAQQKAEKPYFNVFSELLGVNGFVGGDIVFEPTTVMLKQPEWKSMGWMVLKRTKYSTYEQVGFGYTSAHAELECAERYGKKYRAMLANNDLIIREVALNGGIPK